MPVAQTAGAKALRRLQIGAELTTDPGVAVAATTRLRMSGTIEDQRTIVFPAEDIGVLSGVNRSYAAGYLGAITIEGEATFEQLGYIFQAGIEQTTSTTDTGTGTGYIYTYHLPILTPNSIQTYTIESGDNIQVEEMPYSFVKDFTLSGNAGEAWMVSANFVGREVNVSTDGGTSTTDVSGMPITSVEECIFSMTKLYIADDTDTTFSSTDLTTGLVSNTLLSAELKVTTGFQEVLTADGTMYFGFVKQVMPEIMLNITFEHNGSSIAEKVKWRANTGRSVRLTCYGSALAAAGRHTYKTLEIELTGAWEKFEKIDEQNGNDIVKGTMRCRYSVGAAKFGQFLIVNNLAALP